jgi:hypothetical protein
VSYIPFRVFVALTDIKIGQGIVDTGEKLTNGSTLSTFDLLVEAILSVRVVGGKFGKVVCLLGAMMPGGGSQMMTTHIASLGRGVLTFSTRCAALLHLPSQSPTACSAPIHGLHLLIPKRTTRCTQGKRSTHAAITPPPYQKYYLA